MNKNVFLINPAVNTTSQSRIINRIISKAIPTSIGVLAGSLISRNISSVGIFDEQIGLLSQKDMESCILSLEPPRIIGISVLTINAKRAYYLCEGIKNIDPQALIVVGGIHPSVLPDEALSHKAIDIVVRGEGEGVFCDLVKLVLSRGDYRKIYGISYKENGCIVHNPLPPLIDNLDEIPPFPYHLFAPNLKYYSTFGAVFTSRGCPYDCIFCSSRSISGRKYRLFSVERVVSEIELLAKDYKQKIICIMDDNIAANQSYFFKLLKLIIKNGLHTKTSFHGSLRGDNVNEEVLDLAKAANFRLFSFGLETGSESLMRLINKQETVKQVADAIKMTEAKGIAAAATIIFGLPTETSKDRWDTMRLVRKLPLSSVRFNTLTPYPGTPAFEKLNREKKIVKQGEWENFAVQYMWEGDNLPYVPEGNNRYELIFEAMFANLSYYLSLNGLKRMLKSSFAGGNVIILPQRWYLSSRTLSGLFSLFFYLTRRFLYITIRYFLATLKSAFISKKT